MSSEKVKVINNNEAEVALKKIKIRDLGLVDGYIYFSLSNGQIILTNKGEIYDISEYSSISGIYTMKDKVVAVLLQGNTLFAIDLKTKEVLLETTDAYDAYKIDEKSLKVIMKVNGENNNIYDIETKKYISIPGNFEFEESLGANLYIYKSYKNKEDKYWDYKHCLVDGKGNILLKDIDGNFYLNGNYLIITEKEKIRIINLAEKDSIKTIEKNDIIIAKPAYYENMLVIIQKEAIKLYTPAFELIKEIPLSEVEKIMDYEIVNDTLKLWVPDYTVANDYGKHIFINLKTGKQISHLRLEAFPYYKPKTYVGRDSFDSKNVIFHFYDEDFKKIKEVIANKYECLDTSKENIFEITSADKCEVFNALTGNLKEIDYDYFEFHNSLPFGFGINESNHTMDFFDEDLNVVIPNFDYEKYDLSLGRFKYFIINAYLCVIKNFTDGYGQTRHRTIIEKAGGEVILDSYTKQCYAMGNYIQIMGKNKTKFLNTLTGEIGPLNVIAKTDSKGFINLNQIKDFNNHLTIESNHSQQDVTKQKKIGQIVKNDS